MIEAKVPKDIRKYETKVIGTLTLRQLLVTLCAVFLDIILFVIFFKSLHVSTNAIVYILIAIDVPIFCFLLKPQGMTFEKYLKYVLKDSLFKPKNRKLEDIVIPQPKYTADEKTYQQEADKLAKRDPKYKAYK